MTIRVFCPRVGLSLQTLASGTNATVLPKGRSSTANSRTKVPVLLGMNRCGSLPMFSEPLSLYHL